jgi:probable F420-dependent oxidoreductase
VRERLGRFGVWCTADEASADLAAAVECLGYGTIWLGRADGDLDLVERLLAATSTIVVATGIVNIWRHPAGSVAAAYHRVERRHPGRVLLGVGVGHRETDGDSYRRPYPALCRYLDDLDAGGVPAGRRALAALGPKVLRLSAERAVGAHPYLVPVDHTRFARDALGPAALLAPEQRVLLDTDPDRARTTARAAVTRQLRRTNYARNMRRLGHHVPDGRPTDDLLDRLVPHGDPAAVAAALTEHLRAGADHVAVHLVSDVDPLSGYTTLAAELFPGRQP